MENFKSMSFRVPPFFFFGEARNLVFLLKFNNEISLPINRDRNDNTK